MTGLLRAHKIRLIPSTVQVAYFPRCVGTSRFACNWVLSHSAAFYREQKNLILLALFGAEA